jgi:hypothetical protein
MAQDNVSLTAFVPAPPVQASLKWRYLKVLQPVKSASYLAGGSQASSQKDFIVIPEPTPPTQVKAPPWAKQNVPNWNGMARIIWARR